MYFCQFCNEMKGEEHIQVCPQCKGQLHIGSAKRVCATCGRSFDLEKPKKEKVEKLSDVVTKDAEPKALMVLEEEG